MVNAAPVGIAPAPRPVDKQDKLHRQRKTLCGESGEGMATHESPRHHSHPQFRLGSLGRFSVERCAKRHGPGRRRAWPALDKAYRRPPARCPCPLGESRPERCSHVSVCQGSRPHRRHKGRLLRRPLGPPVPVPLPEIPSQTPRGQSQQPNRTEEIGCQPPAKAGVSCRSCRSGSWESRPWTSMSK